MKFPRLAVLGLASLAPVALTAPAHAADGNWYMGIEGGLSVANSSPLNNTAPGVSGSVDQGNNLALGFNVGYDFGPVRMEGQFLHLDNDADTVTFTNDGGLGAGLVGKYAADSGSTRVNAAMLNILYDFDFGQKQGITPYVGGGVGWGSLNYKGYSAVGTPIVDDSKPGTAFQLIAGLRAKISKALSMTADYRYFGTQHLTMTDAIGDPINTKFRSNVFMVGLVWSFGAEAQEASVPAPVAAVAEPAPEPAAEAVEQVEPAAGPAPAPEKVGPFIVYFDWNSTVLTADANAEIERAAQAARDKAPVQLEVKGYADSSGPERYNTPLSTRRAAAVKAALIAAGVPEDSIGTWGYGEDNLAVWTEDNVRERQNRRVEIIFK